MSCFCCVNIFCCQILQRNQKLLEAVVDELVQKKSLSKADFFHLVDLHGSLEPVPASIIDIRLEKHSEVQKNVEEAERSINRT